VNILDSILNFALLFLWIDWRAGRGLKQAHSVLSLASAVRPADRRGCASGWAPLGIIAAILLIRPCFYYSIGSKLSWTPEIDLLAFTLPWRSDLLDIMYLYSTVTFLLTLGLFFSVSVLLSVVNRRLPDSDIMQHLVRLQLGWLERLPWIIRLALPVLAAALAWISMVPLLTRVGLLPAQPPIRVLWGQALALGLCSLLAWKWALLIIFGLHLVNLYVYLGTHPAWAYISNTARSLLRPLGFLSFAKVDLSPMAGIALVIFAAEYGLKPAILQIFERFSG
jgi:hypothetical protein